MKILLLSNMYPSPESPNYGVFVRRTEQLLEEAGHEVKRVVLTKQPSRIKKLAGYMGYVAALFHQAAKFKPDVLYVHYASQNAKPVLWLKKRLPDLPVVLNVHGTDVLPQTAAQEKYQPAVAQLMEAVSHVVVPSTFYKETVREKYGYDGPVTVFPSGGVDTSVFFPAHELGESFRSEHGIPSDAFVAGYISRIDTGKGWDSLLEAAEAADIPNLHVVVAGSGAQEEQFREQAARLKVPLTKLPMLTQQEMNKAFNAMDVFCFPTHQESLGLVGLEAMACGTPIIVSDIPGVKDYAEAENSWSFEAGRAEQLAARMEQAAGQARDSYSTAAIKTAHCFDQHRVKYALLDVFNSTTEKEDSS